MGSVPTTAHLGLAKPPSGETGWATQINSNWDTVDSAVYALQQGGTTGPAGPTGATGAVGMIYTGPWSSSVSYVVTDVVMYNGSTYIATAANTNTPPDVNGNSWSLVAAMGATGPAGPTGPTGPAGSAVAFPITVPQGGTGATTPSAARANLVAAASGANADITSLAALVTTTTRGAGAIEISSPGGSGNAILITNGTDQAAISSDGIGYFTSLEVAGSVVVGNLQASGLFQVNQIGDATTGQPVSIVSLLLAASGLSVQGSAPTVQANQVGIGAGTASTASAGGGQTVPGTVLGFLIWNIAGVTVKIPYFAN